MAEIFVMSSQALEDKIVELTNLRMRFIEAHTAIDNEQKVLTGKWKGDASTAFSENWQRESNNFDTLADVLEQYITALTNIKTNYEIAESANSNIANN